MKTATKKTRLNNLGFRGYLITFCMFLLFMLDVALTSDFLNISVEAIASRTGWSQAAMLSVSTVAGWIALVASLLAGRLLRVIGPRKLMTISLLLFALCTFFLGSVNFFFMYVALTILISALNNIQLGISMNTVIASWFPRKKGIVMGWATIGMSFSTIAFLPFFTQLNEQHGIAFAYRIIGIICLVICVFCFLIVRDLPEECGKLPDNDSTVSREELDKEAAQIQQYMAGSPWDVKTLLRTKQTWQISIMCGIGMMIATGVLSQFVPRFLSLGGDVGSAAMIMSLGGLISLPFSYIWGLLDAKFGPKYVTTLLLCLYAVSLIVILLAGGNFIGCLLAIVMFMSALSGINNMFVSYTASVFGRYDFGRANGLMFPIYMAVRALAFAMVGIGTALLGGYTGVYILFFVFSLIAIMISIFTKADCIGRMHGEEP